MVHVVPSMTRRRGPGALGPLLVLALLAGAGVLLPSAGGTPPTPTRTLPALNSSPANDSAVGNFTASDQPDGGPPRRGGERHPRPRLGARRAELVLQRRDQESASQDRARDALVGTLLFVAAITGLVWGLAHWVLTGA